jgi:kinesin family protein 3/17
MGAMMEAVERDVKEKADLMAKIAAMESKVVSGGENLLDKVDDLKKRSEGLKRQAEVAKRQEGEMKRRQQEIEMQHMDAEARFSSLEEEVQVKGRQLKKLFEKYQSKKAEMGDLQEQFQREREGMLEDYRILTQQIKLKNLIIACFIPPDYQDKIMQHCHWQDYEGAWNIDFLNYAGNAIRAHQEMHAHDAAHGGTSEEEKLANVYFSYAQLADEGAPAHGGGKRVGGIKGKEKKASGDPTNIGTLREQLAYNEAEDKARRREEASTPKARGLVKDTQDPRLRRPTGK